MSCTNELNLCPNCEDATVRGIDKCYKNFCSHCLAELPEDGEWGRVCEDCELQLQTTIKMVNVTTELINQIMGGASWGR